ncbi:MAG: Glycosyl transferase GT2 family [Candidatus Moranbacteria bacterium GW2011_GWF2_36_839]|nr:MAG: Glycosyl transferase GT2 family [Candidatus Moranbacteria bacterium GW2011_GWF1_36_78]KKQ17692.1 MAG: Glycosyl transferase GT2 family [Candidatus Moranbacteria bacterium GW2011_GWF2_36_839]HAT73394.1 glycosyltransferase [Candidatus Moranbacteria bacterium]HBY10757.1 glycosyltransferase [Candidatus Moranbacteria bacterium]
MSENKKISVVVPLYNEEGNVKNLHAKILSACQNLGREFEIIFIDDGSKDKTVENCQGLSPLKLIEFRRNFGQTAAFDAGIKNAEGDIIITMDGDLQNDPADIGLLLEEMEKGFDIVSGWRFNRKDNFSKKFFSRGANLLRKILIHDKIHDSGCSLKAYRKECFADVDLFGEMHRFIPALLELQGYKVGEVKVSHHPRVSGVTKYNWKRGMKGFVDMVSIWFWGKYSNRPLHLFGGSGIILSLAGFGILTWMAIGKIFFAMSLSQKIWPLMGVFFIMIGIQLFIFGLLADILVKNYYKSQNRMNYSIKEIKES